MKVVSLLSDNGKPLYRVYGDDKLPFKVVNTFLSFQENRGRSSNTVRSHAYDLVLYFRFLRQAAKSWHHVGIDDWVNFVQYLKCSTKDEALVLLPVTDKNARTASTINRVLSTINTFYKYYHASGDVQMPSILECISNPFANSHSSFLSFASKSRPRAVKRSVTIGKQQVSTPIPKTINAETQKLVVRACNNRRDRLLILLLIETGMRIGQAIGIKHEDIESWNKQILIKYRENNPNQALSKSRITQYIHISEHWLNLYTDYLMSDVDGVDSDFVFSNLYNFNNLDRAAPTTYATVKALFKRISKKIGVNVTPHMMRHSHATELLRSGVSIEIVAKRLGHRSIETTKRIYEHLTAEDLKNELHRHRDESALLSSLYSANDEGGC